MGWENLEEALEELETEKKHDGYFCSVKDAAIIAILGSLCGLKNVRQIHMWASSEIVEDFLYKNFEIKRVPCYWWLLSLLAIIKPNSLNQCMQTWVSSLMPDFESRLEKEAATRSKKKKALTIAIDGKEIRSTEKMDGYDSPIHIVSAQVGELGLTLAQKTVDSKSNEIPAVQELIKTLEISGCVVVADALNCQIDSAKAVIKAKADYLLSVRDNQRTLKEDIEDYVQEDKLRSGMECFKKKERGHGRTEIRAAYVTDDVSWMPGGREWPGLKTIGAIQTHFEGKDTVSDEWHYYISSRRMTARELLHHARTEWTVETMHWLLDVHFDEDSCRVQSKNLQQNLNMIRKFALNLLRLFKHETKSKDAFSHTMFFCLMNPNKLLSVFGKN